MLWLESPAPAGRKQVESKGVLRPARPANGNGDAAGSSSFLLALPRLTSAAFMRNRLRQTHPAVGALGPEQLSLPPAVAVSKGPGTEGSNAGLARSIRGAGRARCARPVARRLAHRGVGGSAPIGWRPCGPPGVHNGECGRAVWATHGGGTVG